MKTSVCSECAKTANLSSGPYPFKCMDKVPYCRGVAELHTASSPSVRYTLFLAYFGVHKYVLNYVITNM